MDTLTNGGFIEVLTIVWSNIDLVFQEWMHFISFDKFHNVSWDSEQSGFMRGPRLCLLPQSWSISLELLFYAIIPFVLPHRKLLIGTVILSLIIHTSLIWNDAPLNSWGRRFLFSEWFYFGFGACAYKFQDILKLVKLKKFALPCLFILLAMCMIADGKTTFNYMVVYPCIGLAHSKSLKCG